MSDGERDLYGAKIIAAERDFERGFQYRAFRALLLVTARLVGEIYGIKKELKRNETKSD